MDDYNGELDIRVAHLQLNLPMYLSNKIVDDKMNNVCTFLS